MGDGVEGFDLPIGAIKSPKLCVECHFHETIPLRRLDHFGGVVNEARHMCHAREQQEISLVTGELMKFGMVGCEEERMDFAHKCGPKGRLWRAKGPEVGVSAEINTQADVKEEE